MKRKKVIKELKKEYDILGDKLKDFTAIMTAAPADSNTCNHYMSRMSYIQGAMKELEYAISLLEMNQLERKFKVSKDESLPMAPADPDLPDTPEPEYVTETFGDLKFGKRVNK